MTRTPQLAAALLARHAPTDRVAFGAGGPRTASELRADAARVADALPEPAPGAHVVLVFQHDRYAFAAALLGAWHRGFAVALPPNTRRDAIGEVLARPEVALLLHDTAAGLGLRVPGLLAGDGAAPEPLAALTLPAGVVATAFTSGSSGTAIGWPKTAGQLIGEALALRDLFAVAPATCVVPTVGPTHIYGLLLSALLPLVAGAAFLRETPLLPEAVAARLAAGALLVTVPAHLRTFEALTPGALSGVGRVITSTAPLSTETAAALRTRHGVVATELLGSTETGGLAWRLATDDDPSWGPLPGVTLAVAPDGRLLVDSPFLDPALPRPYRTADLAAAAPGGRIFHRGRADDVVKIGGRRVSLRAVEAALLALDGVEDAAVLAVADPGGRHRRLLALAVAPGQDGDALRRALAHAFDPSTLPRRIHLLPALPRESNGKLQRTRALRAVGLGPDGQPRALAIRWEDGAAVTVDGDGGERRVFRGVVPTDFAWYDGHFPTYPVMAGGIQLHELVMPCVRRALPGAGRVTALTRVKFLGRIAPGDAIAVALAWQPGQDAVDFSIAVVDPRPPERDSTIPVSERTCSSGRLTLATSEEDSR